MSSTALQHQYVLSDIDFIRAYNASACVFAFGFDHRQVLNDHWIDSEIWIERIRISAEIVNQNREAQHHNEQHQAFLSQANRSNQQQIKQQTCHTRIIRETIEKITSGKCPYKIQERI